MLSLLGGTPIRRKEVPHSSQTNWLDIAAIVAIKASLSPFPAGLAKVAVQATSLSSLFGSVLNGLRKYFSRILFDYMFLS